MSSYAFGQILTGYFNDNPDYVFHEVDKSLPALKEAIDDVVCESCGRAVQRRYYDLWNDRTYELALATDRAIYYSYEDMALMLSAEDGSIISNNYFAEEGLATSLEDIIRGEEEEIWCDPSLEEWKTTIASEL